MAVTVTSTLQDQQFAAEPVRMLVLARSVKGGQFCVAGKRIVSPSEPGESKWRLGEWIRPVTCLEGSSDAVPGQAFRCTPLAKVQMSLGRRAGGAQQPENRLWSETKPIRSLGMSNRQCLVSMPGLFDQPQALWDDPRARASNRVLEDFEATDSLQLVRVSDLQVYGQKNAMGDQRVYARFVYNGKRYDGFSVTDPQVWSHVDSMRRKGAADGPIRLPHGDDYWITLSLTKAFGPTGCRYKVAAAFI